jgi:hypothetical protein
VANPVPARSDAEARVLCEGCGATADEHALGWRAYLPDEPEVNDFPYKVVYCPKCAEREFRSLSHAERRAS